MDWIEHLSAKLMKVRGLMYIEHINEQKEAIHIKRLLMPRIISFQ